MSHRYMVTGQAVMSDYRIRLTGVQTIFLNGCAVLKKGYVVALIGALPFIFSLFGYWSAHLLLGGDVVVMPALVGLPLYQAVPELCEREINIRVVGFKEDADLESGLVVSQSPFSGQQIRQGQAAHVVVTRKPPKLLAPRVVGLLPESAQSLLNKNSIVAKMYELNAKQPRGVCLAQLPESGTALEKKRMVVYRASSQDKPMLLPNLVGRPIGEVRDLFAPYNIALKVTGMQKTRNCRVKEQRPLAGSFLYTSKPFTVHIQV